VENQRINSTKGLAPGNGGGSREKRLLRGIQYELQVDGS
jgi:hypothetical protein